MYYKIDLLTNGILEIIDTVDEKPKGEDGFIYATPEEVAKIKPVYITNNLKIDELMRE